MSLNEIEPYPFQFRTISFMTSRNTAIMPMVKRILMTLIIMTMICNTTMTTMNITMTIIITTIPKKRTTIYRTSIKLKITQRITKSTHQLPPKNCTIIISTNMPHMTHLRVGLLRRLLLRQIIIRIVIIDITKNLASHQKL